MDWNAFFGVITWCVALVSVITSVASLFFAFMDETLSARTARILYLVAACCGSVTVLSAATIVGMGWMPQ